MSYKNLFMVLGTCLTLLGCSKEETASQPETASMEFRLSARTGSETTAPDAKKQSLHLYMGVDMKEHLTGKGHLELYGEYDDRNLQGNSFQLWLLTEQRYRMAFFCVPKLDGIFTQNREMPSYGCDYNAQMIDFGKVLEAQKNDADMVKYGHIYRKVISRWAQSGEALREDVTLTRLNGQLVIDMGILADQFEKTVTSIEVVLKNVPDKLYIRDNDNDELLLGETTATAEYVYKSIPDSEKPGIHHLITLNLLPSELEGVIRVTETGKTAVEYPIKGGYVADNKVSIKRNTRTTLEFNGLHKDYFTVKYAGFDGSSIDVDDDKWDGWEDL